MNPAGPSVQDIERRSRQAGLFSLAGFFIVVGSLAWSAWQLRGLDKQIVEKQGIIVRSEEAVAALNSEQHRLALEKSTLSAETQRLNELLVTEEAERRRLADSNQQLTVQAAELQKAQQNLEAAVSEAQEKLAVVKAESDAQQAEMKLKLDGLRQEADKVEAELQRKKDELRAKQQELASYEKQYTLANRQWQQSLQVVRREVPATDVPVSAVVQPQASARKVETNLFECYIWLEVPEKRREEIKSVSYAFNHPTFDKKVLQSANAGQKFAVGYRGWGALRLVIITLELRSGGKAEIAFDMAQALGLAGRSSGGKVPFNPGFKPSPNTPHNVPLEDLTKN